MKFLARVTNRPQFRSGWRMAFWAGVVAIVATVLTYQPSRAAGNTEALVLSCMDYRLVDDTEHYFSERGMKEKYDHVVLAGASLGAVTDKYPAWNQTFWDHLEVAIQLHHITKVIVLDHRDCGAYRFIIGEDFGKVPEKETAAHAAQLNKLMKQITAKYPLLDIELLLMTLAGKVEKIGGVEKLAARRTINAL